MKKLILVLTIAFFLSHVTDAQIFKYGIKAGIGFSSIQIEDITGIDDGTDVYNLVTGDGVMGYHVGLQTRIKIAMLYLQPELYFNAGGGTIDQVVSGGATEVLNVKFNRIDLPLLVGVKLGPIRLNAGPVGSYVISGTNEIIDLIPDYKVFTSGMTWGFQAGIGVGLSKFSLDARYEGSLSAFGDSFTVGGSNFALDARPSQWIISLGVWF